MSSYDHLLDAAGTLDDASYAEFAEAVAAEVQRRTEAAEAAQVDRTHKGR